jgi:putative hydrolase of the HAD superfamily
MNVEVENHAPPQPWVFFDMDGTLVECAKYYKEAIRMGAAYIHELTRMPEGDARELIDSIDLQAIRSLPPDEAFFRQRFPASFVKALRVAAERQGVSVTEIELNAMHAIGDAVFDAPYNEYFGASGTVRGMSARGYGVALLTKGDHDVQMRKIVRNGFDHIFDYVMICKEKNESTLREFIAAVNADASQSWVVGDSLKDDIAVGAACGCRTILVQDHPDNAWVYNHHEVEPDFTVHAIVDVLDVIPRATVEAV